MYIMCNIKKEVGGIQMRKCNMCQKEYPVDTKFIFHLAADHSIGIITFTLVPKMIECFDENSTDQGECI